MRRTSYEYEGGTGYLVKVLDTNRVNGQDLHQLARYSYDRAGNRATEQRWLVSRQPGSAWLGRNDAISSRVAASIFHSLLSYSLMITFERSTGYRYTNVSHE